MLTAKRPSFPDLRQNTGLAGVEGDLRYKLEIDISPLVYPPDFVELF